jgi:tetratricopeptide (TPR) repeat protein
VGVKRKIIPFVFGAVLLSASCRQPDLPTSLEQPAPIILISIDTLRSDRLPAYGYEQGATPALDRFSAESVLFERAYTTCPLTLPAHATMMTGLIPPQHGVRENRGFALADSGPTLAAILSDAGYETGGFVSSMVLRRNTGISRGFHTWEDSMNADTSTSFAQRPGDKTVELALQWLDTLQGEQRFFLFLHLYDVHTPYEAPSPYSDQHADPYDAEIAWTDHVLETLFDELRGRGLYDKSIVMLVSDHGEGLGDHVETQHGFFLYRETLQVPMMLRLPDGRFGGRRVDHPVSLIDVGRTLLDLLRIDERLGEGRSLLARAPEVPRGLYAETFFPRLQYGFSELRSAIRDDLHYIDAPRPELFNIVDDPMETNNLVRQRSAPPSLVSVVKDPGFGIESKTEMSDEERERLASLGYVGRANIPDIEGPLPNPKDHIEEVEELFALVDQVGKRPSKDAEVRLVSLMEELGVANEPLAVQLANNLMESNRAAIATRVLAPFAQSDKGATRQLLGQIATDLGRFDEAMGHFQAVLDQSPDHAKAQMGMGIALMSGGHNDEAVRWLDRAIVLNDRLAEAWNARAVLHAQEEQWAAAIGGWEHAVEIMPGLADAWFNLSLAYRQTGDSAKAMQARQRYDALTAGP